MTDDGRTFHYVAEYEVGNEDVWVFMQRIGGLIAGSEAAAVHRRLGAKSCDARRVECAVTLEKSILRIQSKWVVS